MANEQEKETGKHIVNPHDKVTRDFLEEKDTALSFFMEYLPKAITKDMDFSTLRIAKDKFVDQKLSDYFSDILYKVKFRNKRAFIYLLIEHKSYLERFTALQLLKYMVNIWELYLKQEEKTETLPVILPIVIYHGASKWKIDTNFISMFAADTPGYVKEYIPDFQYNFHDISRLPDEKIKGAVLLRILFSTLKYVFTAELKQKLFAILQLFNELNDKQKGTKYLEILLRYLADSARNLTVEDIEEPVKKIIEGGDIMSTIAEKWVEQGRQEGIEKGIGIGIQQGREQGLQKGIQKGLQKGLQKGIKETARNTAKRMLDDGLSLELISKYTGLSLYELKKIKGKVKNVKSQT